MFLENPAGNVTAQTEYDLYRFLEKTYLVNEQYLKEYWLSERSRIDYYIPPYWFIEVKNKWLDTPVIKQIVKYRNDIIKLLGSNKIYEFWVICMGYDKREHDLKELGITPMTIKSLVASLK